MPSFEERRIALRGELEDLQKQQDAFYDKNERTSRILEDQIADKQWEIRDIGRWLRTLGKE